MSRSGTAKWKALVRVGSIDRRAHGVAQQTTEIGTGLLCDAMRRRGAVASAVAPVTQRRRCAGPAFTVEAMVGDNLPAHYALTLVEAGDVIVIDGRACTHAAIWGALTHRAAEKRGVAAVVIDGACRDLAEIEGSTVPLYARAVTPVGPHKGWGGAFLMPISCGGVPITPCDLVVGDEDGIVVIPQAELGSVLAGAIAAGNAEKEWFRRVASGDVPYDFLEFDAAIENVDLSQK